ncbi:hypothetical protein EMIHUDRAFT_97705 [Emiliania huxleyi CCMP1516]|uniref:Uncharacterized protein n=2 Tax=Emiliania huxleyi TaxID=2903 RepID=A0A0D3KUQ8_EMIH1|nr:hypothetical protein EMIHUDRAFT_97705 [Emiliania huxleyi CCMP1516]EOD39493.1 hypothetical protein EMIHUDRAFT_97705 [Emiliania huxleyi CCMP1516]|eukprot:XP_005791922.1 hypothetical protein EMIHUDRAFT_97705 [Emiliania huxleyi CCMP1516]
MQLLLSSFATLHQPLPRFTCARLPLIHMNVVDRTPPWSFNFTGVEPTYTVTDWAAARSVMAEYLNVARASRGAMFSGWTCAGDKLSCREAFGDASFAAEHLVAARETLAKLQAVATLEEVRVYTPAADAALMEAAREAFSADVQLLELDGGATALVRPWGGMSRGSEFCSLTVDFAVSDWAAAAPLMQRCVELAVVEGKGCIYFGFSRNAGCQLVCRSAYATADALEAHLRGASPLAAAVGTLSEDGEIATLDAARLDAPAATLEAMRADTLEYHGCKVQPFSIDPREGGFQRFELTGYNMGLLDLNK